MTKQNKKKFKNKSIVLGIIVTLGVMVTLIGLTYAYYRTRVIGNSEDKTISTPTKMLRVEYEDNTPEVVTDNFFEPGKTLEKSFKVKNTGDEASTYNIVLDKIENKFTRNDLTYKLIDTKTEEEITEGVVTNKLDKQIIIQRAIKCGEIENFKLIIKYENLEDEDQSIDMRKTLSLRVNITGIDINVFESQDANTLLYAIGRDNVVINPLTTPGQQASKEDEAELSYTEDDYGTSYYFRGNVKNNYVTFANMCWRIVRVLGTGDIKLTIMSDTTKCIDGMPLYSNERYSSANFQDNAYMTFTGSTLEDRLNKWLNEHINFENSDDIASEAGNLITNAIWCNDLSMASDELKNNQYFSFYYRNKTPTLKCPVLNNSNTAYKAYQFNSKIAILTADEYEFTGAFTNTNTSYWARSSYWTTMTLTGGVLENGVYIPVNIQPTGYINFSSSDNYGIRATIVVDKSVTIEQLGNGTLESPYIIEQKTS